MSTIFMTLDQQFRVVKHNVNFPDYSHSYAIQQATQSGRWKTIQEPPMIRSASEAVRSACCWSRGHSEGRSDYLRDVDQPVTGCWTI